MLNYDPLPSLPAFPYLQTLDFEGYLSEESITHLIQNIEKMQIRDVYLKQQEGQKAVDCKRAIRESGRGFQHELVSAQVSRVLCQFGVQGWPCSIDIVYFNY